MLRSFRGGGSQARGSLCFGRASPQPLLQAGCDGAEGSQGAVEAAEARVQLCLPRLAACESPGSSMESLGVGAQHEWFSQAVINCNNL